MAYSANPEKERNEDHKAKASLGYIVKSHLRKAKECSCVWKACLACTWYTVLALIPSTDKGTKKKKHKQAVGPSTHKAGAETEQACTDQATSKAS